MRIVPGASWSAGRRALEACHQSLGKLGTQIVTFGRCYQWRVFCYERWNTWCQVSVQIVTYNRTCLVLEALQQIEAQDYAGEIEAQVRNQL